MFTECFVQSSIVVSRPTVLLFMCRLQSGPKSGYLYLYFAITSGNENRFEQIFLAHSKNELMQWRGVRRLSVRLSVCTLLRKSLCRQMAGSPPNFHKMDSRSACIQVVLKVNVKGHVIHALSWILRMSYSVIDGLVLNSDSNQNTINLEIILGRPKI